MAVHSFGPEILTSIGPQSLRRSKKTLQRTDVRSVNALTGLRLTIRLLRAADSSETPPVRHREDNHNSRSFLAIRATKNDVARKREPPPEFVFDPLIKTKRQLLRRDRDAETKEGLNFEVPENHKSGYVAIIGRPNAGKSTLVNALVGQKLAIVTKKPQTTRHRILAVTSEDDYQMILYDTPGMMERRMHKLDEIMMQNVRTAAVNADAVVVVVDVMSPLEEALSMLEEGARAAGESRPVLLAANKADLLRPDELVSRLNWLQSNAVGIEVLAISAKLGNGVEQLRSWAVDQLPIGPAYYPKDIVSEHPERFFVAEIVREKILLQYEKEIPYVAQVNVVEYRERSAPAKDFVGLEIIVERDSQKGIIIGKEGAALKTLATAARLDIEDFVGKRVYLEIKVKVKDKWRQNAQLLDMYGLEGGRQF